MRFIVEIEENSRGIGITGSNILPEINALHVRHVIYFRGAMNFSGLAFDSEIVKVDYNIASVFGNITHNFVHYQPI